MSVAKTTSKMKEIVKSSAMVVTANSSQLAEMDRNITKKKMCD